MQIMIVYTLLLLSLLFGGITTNVYTISYINNKNSQLYKTYFSFVNINIFYKLQHIT